MNIEDVTNYCLSLDGAEGSFPFGETALVIKVGGKIFAILNLADSPSVSLKCDPEWAIELRETNPAIIPGYHLSKKHWNTVILDGSLPNALIISMISHSYDLVFKSLPEKIKKQIIGK